ncbi:unnamed protein product [Acanthoscelides obtectus]|nr:unnamed protein product [Acanthoscelides obtectus]CAK1655115.1 Free fatty acid receptor 4 [Acanthoscelides obtectus]
MDPDWNTSYVFGIDNETGWGGRYFFTYYSELGDKPYAQTILEVAMFSIIFFVSLVANLSIIVCVSRYPDMRTVTNCFVLNLAVADILFTLTIPVVAYTRLAVTWDFGDAACRIVPYVQFVSGIVLLWTLALISIDRHRCIVVPPYRSNISPCQAALASLIIWSSTSLIFVPVTLWFRVIVAEGDPPITVCTMIFPK